MGLYIIIKPNMKKNINCASFKVDFLSFFDDHVYMIHVKIKFR